MLLKQEDLDGATPMKGEGCSKCSGSGYKGRVAIYEIMPITQNMADLIFAKADLNVLTAAAEKDGMRTLRKVAIEKWRTGITSSDEVIAVTSEG